jgi:hypothetical protein
LAETEKNGSMDCIASNLLVIYGKSASGRSLVIHVRTARRHGLGYQGYDTVTFPARGV